MDLRLSDAERVLQGELRSWLEATLPTLPPTPPRDDWPARAAFDRAWQRRLLEAGYAGFDWPTEYGGRGASPAEQLIFLEELARAGAPDVGVNFVGLLHAGPTLMAEGTPEQKAAHLPAILRAEEIWCQGFSEPGAGSDLAALKTGAERDGDEYVVSGQKIWSSFAQAADYAELLVRTDPGAARHRGISWLIVDMSSPGITVRPIRTAMGSSEFSEVFLDEVRVPLANRVGAENDGWRVAMVTFAFERGTAFVTELVQAMRLAGQLAAVARKVTRGSATAWDDVGLRRDLGRMVAELDALWALTKRNVSQASRVGVPGPGGSVLKLRLCEAAQELADLALRILGRAGVALEDVGELASGHFVEERLRSLGLTIGGGTSQIQRNIVAERLLGLPRDPPAAAPGG